MSLEPPLYCKVISKVSSKRMSVYEPKWTFNRRDIKSNSM